MSAADLLAESIAAHGGHERWESAREVAARVSAGGLAFASKGQGRAVRGAEVRVATEGQRTVFEPYPSAGRRGVFEEGAVRIEADDGRVIAERADARSAFRGIRHAVRWDRLDILYFGGYAMWTYVSVPFVLTRPGYVVEELPPWREGDETWRPLRVTFPAGVHTHSREQVFYLDDRGLIRRHDYTAEPFGSWAKAAHYAMDHRQFGGLVVPTSRRVYPRRRDNRPRPFPRLVWIEVGDVRVVA